MSFETEKQKKWIKEERIPYYEKQMKEKGLECKIVVEFDGFPEDANEIKGFDGRGLSSLRNRMVDSAKDPDFKDYVNSKVTTISICGDANIAAPKFEYDAGTKTLKITATPKDKFWVGDPVAYIKKM